jgi:hypothetical protein
MGALARLSLVEILLLGAWALAVYIGLIRGTARLLAATQASRLVLRWAHWGSVGFVLGCGLACGLGGWLIRYPGVFMAVFIGSGWLAGVRMLRGGVPGSRNVWAAWQSWGTLPAALLIALGWLLLVRFDPVYRRGNVTVKVVRHFTLSDKRYFALVFYRDQTPWFEEAVGQVADFCPDGNGYWYDEWWSVVYNVTYDTPARTVTIYRYGSQPVTLSFQP